MKHMLQHKTQSEHPFCIRDEATQISIASLSATHSDGPMKASGYAVRMARRSRDGVRPAGRIHDGPRMTRWPADDESTTARWICDRARPASESTSGSHRRKEDGPRPTRRGSASGSRWRGKDGPRRQASSAPSAPRATRGGAGGVWVDCWRSDCLGA